MADGYIGKISAVVTANTSDLSRKLQGAVKDVDRFSQTLNRSVSSAASQATASLEKIFTPLQRLERKLQTALRLNLRTAAEVREIQSLTQATEQLNKPLDRLQQGFTNLSLEIQAKFAPALRRAQDQAIGVNETISRTGGIAAQQFRSAEQAVNSTSEALQRLSELQKQARAGLTGRELQFSSPAASRALQDAAASSQRAGALPPAALADGGIARQVQRLQTFRDAIARTAAEVEELRLRPNVDLTVLSAAERRLNNIIATTTKAQQQLDSAVEISQNIGASTQLRSATDPTGRTIQQRGADILRVRQAAEEEAAFRQRAADSAEREAAAVERLSQAQNRLLAQEIQRNSGAAARRNAAAFDAATAGVLDRRAPVAGVFERPARTLDSELARTDQLRQEFFSLPQDVQQSLENERRAMNNVGNAARDGAASLGLLTDANDRMAASIADANRRLGEQGQLMEDAAAAAQRRAEAASSFLQVDQRESDLMSQQGRRTDRDPSGRTIQERARDMQAMENANRLNSLGSGLNQTALSGFERQLSVIQRVMSSVAGEASGPLVAAFDAVQQRIRAAMNDGTIRTRAVREEIEAMIQALGNAAARTANINVNALSADLRRVGDVGRRGLDRFGLAAQQAAFAVDDFFSVTGGLEQRIRAISNNLTQLAFILGGTTGLFAGLGVVIGGQVLLFFDRWINSGRAAEDRTKSLNDALEKQRSILDSIKEAFSAIEGALTRGIFTDAQQQANEFTAALKRLNDERRKAAEEAVLAANPRARDARADLARGNRMLSAADSFGAQVAAQALVADARRRERAASGILVAPPPGDTAVEQTLRRRARAPFRNNVPDLPGGDTLQDLAARRRALEAPMADIAAQLPNADSIFDAGLRFRILTESFSQLNELATRLDQAISALVDQGIGSAAQTALAASAIIGDAQKTAAEAIEAGASGARAFAARAGAAGQQLQDAVNALEAAAIIENPLDRAAALDAAQAQVDAAFESAKALDEQRAALQSLTATVNVFAATIDRISTQLANTVAQEARSAADQARRDANAAAATVDRGAGGLAAMGDRAFADRQRRRAEENARQAEDRAAEVTRQNDRARDDFERDARRGGLGANAQELIGERDAIDALLREDITNEEQRRNLERRRQEIDRQLGRQFEDSPAGREARDRADRADREAAARAQREEDIRRGRELGFSPAEQAGRQLADDLRALEAARDERLAAGGPAGPIQQDFAADRKRIIEESFRSTAPAIFALADEVANAIVQGPSRAALEVSDVSTVEGARELNRLLRGEDSARDQNLIELQKQSQSLDELVRIAREGGAPIAP